MCGISGVWRFDGARVTPAELHASAERLVHRGPDDEGYLLVDTVHQVAEARRGHRTVALDDMPLIDSPVVGPRDLGFAFRRLAILDLTPAGHQPMADHTGQVHLVFNGEIYNYVELREELCASGYHFRSSTDTEVILNAYLAWGERCLERFNGMWAFVLWDARHRRLFCARDRFGIKPLYYYTDAHQFVFGSEIKAVLAYAGVKVAPNDARIADYLVSAQVDHTDETFFTGIRQVPAAHQAVVENGSLRLQRYWSLTPGEPVDPATAKGQFRTLFEDAVRIHLRSDVPVGTCLSGGLDSSAIAGVAQQLLLRSRETDAVALGPRLRTFSSCFDDARYDERQYIQAVLQRTGAEPTYTFPRAEEIPELMPRLMWHQDEPCASSSVFAQWCVMRAAADRGVHVLLDGQGGDELLAGYHTYFGFHFADLLRAGALRRLAEEMRAYARLHGVSLGFAAARLLEPLLGGGLRRLGRSYLKGAHSEVRPEYRRLALDPSAATPGPTLLWSRLQALLERFSLPALLRYEDRNSMAFSIEARVPFLDVRLVDFAFALPAELKIADGRTKVLLRDALADVLPETVRERHDKMGFVTPETEWFRGVLRAWAEEIIYSPEFAERPYWDVRIVRALFDEYVDGRGLPGTRLWRWVNLELWLRAHSERQEVTAAA